MEIFRRFGLELACFILVSLLADCYLAPEPGRLPDEQTTLAPTLDSLNGTSQGTTNLLAGTISGLDPGDSATLRLESVEASLWSQLLPTPPTGQTLGPCESSSVFGLPTVPGRQVAWPWSRGTTG